MALERCGLALLAILCACSAPFLPNDKVLTGLWGGDEFEVRVQSDKMYVVFDCYETEFRAPIFLKDDGSFSATGVVTPMMNGSFWAGVTARVSGVVRDGRMTVVHQLRDPRGVWARPDTFGLVAGQRAIRPGGDGCVA